MPWDRVCWQANCVEGHPHQRAPGVGSKARPRAVGIFLVTYTSLTGEAAAPKSQTDAPRLAVSSGHCQCAPRRCRGCHQAQSRHRCDGHASANGGGNRRGRRASLASGHASRNSAAGTRARGRCPPALVHFWPIAHRAIRHCRVESNICGAMATVALRLLHIALDHIVSEATAFWIALPIDMIFFLHVWICRTRGSRRKPAYRICATNGDAQLRP